MFNWRMIDAGGGGGTSGAGLGTLAAVGGEAGSGNNGISGDLTLLLANDGFWAIC